MTQEITTPQKISVPKRRYTRKGRLNDVIRLIYVLSQGNYAFRSETAIHDAIRGKPLSAKTWEVIALSHPEFFRPQGEGTMFALLIRSYFQRDDNEVRQELTVEQTQKLIDVAIALHDKEIQRRQMNSYLYPLIIALFALGGTIFTPFVTSWLNKDNNKSIERIDSTVTHIERLLTAPPPPTTRDSVPAKLRNK